MNKIKRLPVVSSQIVSAGYSPGTRELDIEFKPFRKGSEQPVYRYSKVTPEEYAAFMNSGSKGRYFIEFIKPHTDLFPFRKLGAHEL